MPTAVKTPATSENPPARSSRQKARLKQLQARLRYVGEAFRPLAKGNEALEVAVHEKPSSANVEHEPVSVEEELRDLIVEVLRSSPATAAQVNARLQAAVPATDSLDAGLALVRQMQQSEGGAWTGAELSARFGLTPATLHRRRAEYRILFWRDAQEKFHYPKWQFTPVGASQPGVQEVLQTFRSSDEWRLMRYFLAPRKQLDDQTPLALLQKGEKAKVVAHACVHGKENTW